MNKKIRIIVFGLIILLLINLLFFLIINSNEEEKTENKVWMVKTPHQCGDNTVPNSIYFDYLNTLFPNNEDFPEFPINFSQKKNGIELYDAEAKYYEDQMSAGGENEIEIEKFILELKEGYDLDSLNEEEIIIYDAEKISREDSVASCAACSCSAGYVVYLLIEEKDVNLLLTLGYEQSKEPK